MMEFDTLTLTRVTYGVDKGRLVGRIDFRGLCGAMSLSLSPEAAKAMLALVADQMVISAKEVATGLTAELIEQAVNPALEHNE